MYRKNTVRANQEHRHLQAVPDIISKKFILRSGNFSAETVSKVIAGNNTGGNETGDPAGKTSGTRVMVFSRSITFDDEDIGNAVAAAGFSSVTRDAETEFITALKAEEPDAFEKLIDRYSDEIYGLLYRITEDAEEAGDLTQETFISAVKAVKGFRGESELKTWLFRIALNHSRNRFRWWSRRGKNITISLDAEIGESGTPMSEMIGSSAATPEEAAISNERQRELAKALNELPEQFREAVILCDIEGMSYQEIADTLEINVGTVRSRIARGREELRRKLKDI